jgi:hypothetical protein
MPYDTAPQPWTDLGAGWAYDETGRLIQTRTDIEDAIAEHGFGGTYCDQPLTRLTRGRLLADGGTFICLRDGHLPDLSIVRCDGHSAAYRLRLDGPSAVRAAERVARLEREAA